MQAPGRIGTLHAGPGGVSRRRTLVVKIAAWMATNRQRTNKLFVRAAREDELSRFHARELMVRLLRGFGEADPRWFDDQRVDRAIDAVREVLFAPATVHHRPRQTLEQRALQEIFAAGVVVLVERGASGRRAADTVAVLARRRKLLRPDGQAITATTVYDWWRKHRRAAGCKEFARELRASLGDRAAAVDAMLEDFLQISW